MENQIKRLKNLKLKDNIIFYLIVFLLIFCLGYHYYKEYNISINEEQTIGVVIEFFHINKARYAIKYQYQVNDIEYIGQVGVHVFTCDNGKKGCVGKEFEVYYSSKNPQYSRIDLGKYENQKTKIEFIK